MPGYTFRGERAVRLHRSILAFEGGRYLKWALAVCAASIAAYAWHDPASVYLRPYGGTALGYTFGTIGAVLILWLLLLGVRKRSYASSLGTVQGWTSAHVYLGSSHRRSNAFSRRSMRMRSRSALLRVSSDTSC